MQTILSLFSKVKEKKIQESNFAILSVWQVVFLLGRPFIDRVKFHFIINFFLSLVT